MTTEKFVSAESVLARENYLLARLRIAEDHGFLLVEALAEIRAAVDGQSNQPVHHILLGTIEEVRIHKARQREIGPAAPPAAVLDLSDLTLGVGAAEYLLGLAERLRSVPATYDIDGGDVGQLVEIASLIRQVSQGGTHEP